MLQVLLMMYGIPVMELIGFVPQLVPHFMEDTIFPVLSMIIKYGLLEAY